MPEIQSGSILTEVIISIAASVGGGTYLGYLLSERRRRKQEEEDITKTKELLRDNIERLHAWNIDYVGKLL